MTVFPECAACLPDCDLAGTLAGVGETPLLPLPRLSRECGATILAKAEYLNPTGSIKDRIAAFILRRAEFRGDLRPESTILEVTSGNTGIALARAGRMRGYRVVLMMPRSVSVERRKMIAAFGAELELLDDLLRMEGAIEEAESRAASDRSIFIPRQFSNPDNPLVHELTTGPEILRQTGGRLDAFVMGIGTGGTLMGTGAVLARFNPAIELVAVEPAESAVLSGGPPGRHGIQGLADGFVPAIVDRERIDRVVAVPTEAAVETARRLAREEGLLVGISAGANVFAAMELARERRPGGVIVTVLPDRGERYLSVL